MPGSGTGPRPGGWETLAYRTLTTPEDGSHTPKHVGVDFGTY
jgi:hypothetical protein